VRLERLCRARRNSALHLGGLLAADITGMSMAACNRAQRMGRCGPRTPAAGRKAKWDEENNEEKEDKRDAETNHPEPMETQDFCQMNACIPEVALDPGAQVFCQNNDCIPELVEDAREADVETEAIDDGGGELDEEEYAAVHRPRWQLLLGVLPLAVIAYVLGLFVILGCAFSYGAVHRAERGGPHEVPQGKAPYAGDGQVRARYLHSIAHIIQQRMEFLSGTPWSAVAVAIERRTATRAND